MPYYVSKSDGSIITVLDGTKDTTSTSLTLFGRLATNYGDETNENFVHLLENFSSNIEPAFPITGQLYFDKGNTSLKIYSIANTWIPIGSVISSNVDIGGNLELGGAGFSIKEVGGNVQFTNSFNFGNVSFFSNVNGTSTRIINFNGVTGLPEVNGNAVSSLGIPTKIYVDSLNNVVLANLSLRTADIDSINANLGSFQTYANSKFTNITTNIDSINANLGAYQTYSNLSLQALNATVNGIVSGTGSVNTNELRINSNVALNNSGTGNVAINLKTPGGITILSAQGSNTANTPVTILGQWNLGFEANIEATYADLAEYYEGDMDYEPGTVVVFGGAKEVTSSTYENDTRVVGVVTTNPAYTMNSQQQGIKVCVALVGRVPCKVVGEIQKGDLLTTSDIDGHAKKASNPQIGTIIGKAIEEKNNNDIGIIQIAVGRV
jgi:hypothetical protein